MSTQQQSPSTVPSLASLSVKAGVKQLKSDAARYLLETEGEAMDVDLMEAINHEEMSHIKGARGRISDSEGRCNLMGKITGARFQSYDSKRDVVTIRVDDPKITEFWLEIPIKMDHLRAWIDEQKTQQ